MAALNLSLYPPSISSTVEPDHGITLDYADGGTLHRRGLYAAQHYVVTLNWDLLALAQRDYLEDFILRYRLETVTFSLDGHDYTGELIGGPVRRWVDGTLYGLTAQYRATRATATDPIAALFARLGASGMYVDPLTLSSVYADTAGVAVAVLNGAVARIDALPGAPVAARFWNDTAANRPLLRADGLEFDGTNDSLTYPDDPALRFGTTDFTLAAAIKPNDLRNDNRFFSKSASASTGTTGKWGIFGRSANIMAQYDFPGNTGGQDVVVITGLLAIGAWADVIVSLDRQNAQWLPHANGVSYTPVALPSSGVGNISNTAGVQFGAIATAAFYYGTICRALAIDKVLSASDRAIVNDWLNAGH